MTCFFFLLFLSVLRFTFYIYPKRSEALSIKLVFCFVLLYTHVNTKAGRGNQARFIQRSLSSLSIFFFSPSKARHRTQRNQKIYIYILRGKRRSYSWCKGARLTSILSFFFFYLLFFQLFRLHFFFPPSLDDKQPHCNSLVLSRDPCAYLYCLFFLFFREAPLSALSLCVDNSRTLFCLFLSLSTVTAACPRLL